MKSGVTDLIAVGRIVKAFGVKGEVVVSYLTDSPERLTRLKRVFLARWDERRACVEEPVTETRVVHARIGPRGARMRLEAIADRDAAERSTGMLLMIGGADTMPLPEGRFYVHDLIGMQVADGTEGTVGTVIDVLRLPAHDVYVIRDGEREWMLPAVEAFIRNVDLASRTITVSLIEGMRE